MNEGLCSILCGERSWTCDDESGNTFCFNEDGTGSLRCHAEFVWWIGAEFTWKTIESPIQIIDVKGDPRNKAGTLLGHLCLEITLIKRLAHGMDPEFWKQSTIPNEKCFKDEAFQPKTYNIRLEKGNFTSPGMTRVRYGPKGIEKNVYSRYALRLLLDRSPFPRRDEMKIQSRGYEVNHFWDNMEFVGRRSPELEEQAKSWTWSNSCTMS